MRSQDYWNIRFEALQEALLQEAEAYYPELEKIYRQALRELEKDILVWYQRLADANGVSLVEAKKMLTANELKEFRWTIEEYIEKAKEQNYNPRWGKELETASARVHISRLSAIQLQLQQHLEVLFGNELDIIEEAMRKIYEDGYYRTAYEVQTGTQIGFDVTVLDDKRIETILNHPWVADGMNFSDRIWRDKQKLLTVLQQELIYDVIRGGDARTLIRRFRERTGATRANAARILSTEAAYFATLGEKDCMDDLGVEQYRILATLDLRTSAICQELDGKIFAMSDFKPGITAPPFHPWCRSCTVPQINNDYGVRGQRAARGQDGKSYRVDADMTYPDWKAVYVDKTKSIETWQKENKERRMRMNYDPPTDEVISILAKEQNKPYTIGKKGVERFYADNGDPVYPPNNGAVGEEWKVTLKKGTVLSRYGQPGGKYASQVGTTIGERAMPRDTDVREENHHLYKVLDSVETYQAEIAPWFGQPGRGVQYRFKERIIDLIEKGLLEEVKES